MDERESRSTNAMLPGYGISEFTRLAENKEHSCFREGCTRMPRIRPKALRLGNLIPIEGWRRSNSVAGRWRMFRENGSIKTKQLVCPDRHGTAVRTNGDQTINVALWIAP
jgi:hypothetical protein